MKVKKIKREGLTTTKWIIEGKGKGWIFDKTFPTKWKAEIALEVFKKGGKVSDYWKAARKYKEKRPKIYPSRVIDKLEEALDEIKELNPSFDEIKEYGEICPVNAITYSKNKGYYSPHLHDTWREKSGGRVHIDIGYGGIHLMLDKHCAYDFIELVILELTFEDIHFWWQNRVYSPITADLFQTLPQDILLKSPYSPFACFYLFCK